MLTILCFLFSKRFQGRGRVVRERGGRDGDIAVCDGERSAGGTRAVRDVVREVEPVEDEGGVLVPLPPGRIRGDELAVDTSTNIMMSAHLAPQHVHPGCPDRQVDQHGPAPLRARVAVEPGVR